MRRAALVLVVAAMHVAALWLLVVATRPHARPAGSASHIAMVEVMTTPPAKVAPAAVQTQAAPRASALRSNAGRMLRDAARSRAITGPDLSASPAAPTASPQAERPTPAPPPLILDSASTRRALREIGRESAVVERANQDLDGHPRSAFDSRWSAGVAGAARGDCRKGEFKGSGMGLLSLPALALAAAKGDCGR